MYYFIPERRGLDFDIIEDIIPLNKIAFNVQVKKEIRKVELVPQKKNVDFTGSKDSIQFVLPELRGHQMIAIHYK